MKNPQIAALLKTIADIEEQGARPYIVIKLGEGVRAWPAIDLQQFLTGDDLILNVGSEAIQNGLITELEDGWITFTSRFRGLPVALTIHISAIKSVGSPDLPEIIQQSMTSIQDQEFQRRMTNHELIKAALKLYNVTPTSTVGIEVQTDIEDDFIDSEMFLYSHPETGAICFWDEEKGDRELTFDQERQVYMPGDFNILSVLIRDHETKHFLAMSDPLQCVVFDQKLMDALSTLQVPEQKAQPEVPKNPAQVLQFPGRTKASADETVATPSADTEHTNNVIDLASHRKK
jgi:stringent starvation protein B